MAHPLAVLTLVAIPVVLLAPFYVAGLLDMDLQGCDWGLLFLLAILLSCFCSYVSSPRRYASDHA